MAKPDMVLAFGTEVNFGKPQSLIVNLDELIYMASNITRYVGAIPMPLDAHLVLTARLVNENKKLLRQTAELTQQTIKYNDSHTILQNRIISILASQPIQTGYAAIHDIHEPIVTDIPSGMKKYLPDYQKLEHSFETAVHDKLRLPIVFCNKAFIKVCDTRAFITEMTLFEHPGLENTHLPATQKELDILDNILNMSTKRRRFIIHEYYNKALKNIKFYL